MAMDMEITVTVTEKAVRVQQKPTTTAVPRLCTVARINSKRARAIGLQAAEAAPAVTMTAMTMRRTRRATKSNQRILSKTWRRKYHKRPQTRLRPQARTSSRAAATATTMTTTTTMLPLPLPLPQTQPRPVWARVRVMPEPMTTTLQRPLAHPSLPTRRLRRLAPGQKPNCTQGMPTLPQKRRPQTRHLQTQTQTQTQMQTQSSSNHRRRDGRTYFCCVRNSIRYL